MQWKVEFNVSLWVCIFGFRVICGIIWVRRRINLCEAREECRTCNYVETGTTTARITSIMLKPSWDFKQDRNLCYRLEQRTIIALLFRVVCSSAWLMVSSWCYFKLITTAFFVVFICLSKGGWVGCNTSL